MGQVWREKERLRQGSLVVGAIVAASLLRAGWRLLAAPGDPVRLVREDISLDPFEWVGAIVAGEIDADTGSLAARRSESQKFRWPRATCRVLPRRTPQSIQRPASAIAKPMPSVTSGVRCWSCKTALPVTGETTRAEGRVPSVWNPPAVAAGGPVRKLRAEAEGACRSTFPSPVMRRARGSLSRVPDGWVTVDTARHALPAEKPQV